MFNFANKELVGLDLKTRKLYQKRVSEFLKHISKKDMHSSIPESTYDKYSKEDINKVIYDQFKTFTATLDKARNQNFYDALPEFKGII